METVVSPYSPDRQIIKLGDSECLKPSEIELDLLLLKELGIESETTKGEN